jgi:hypothetical protein
MTDRECIAAPGRLQAGAALGFRAPDIHENSRSIN